MMSVYDTGVILYFDTGVFNQLFSQPGHGTKCHDIHGLTIQASIYR